MVIKEKTKGQRQEESMYVKCNSVCCIVSSTIKRIRESIWTKEGKRKNKEGQRKNKNQANAMHVPCTTSLGGPHRLTQQKLASFEHFIFLR